MRNLKSIAFATLLVVLLSYCKTEDVTDNGSWEWEVSKNIVNEDDSLTYITVRLSKPTNQTNQIRIRLSGSAQQNSDYILKETTWVLNAGDSTFETEILILQDTIQEPSETLIIEAEQLQGLEAPSPSKLVITIEDDDQPVVPNLLLNEILYDPSNNALDGDANGDGAYAQAADEFIEIINNSSRALDISGFKVFDAENYSTLTPNHVFPDNTILEAGKCIVVFGGGNPTGSFGGALVQTSTSGDLNLNNAGDVLYITDRNNQVLIQFDIEPLSNNPNESYSRDPDLTGDFIQHATINGELFSPGTKSNGDSF